MMFLVFLVGFAAGAVSVTLWALVSKDGGDDFDDFN